MAVLTTVLKRIINELLPKYKLPAGVKFAFSQYYKMPKAVKLYFEDYFKNMSASGYISSSFNNKILNVNHDTSYMFANNKYLLEVPLFDTSKVVNCLGWFLGDHKLQSVPLFDTSNVTNMKGMFAMANSTPWSTGVTLWNDTNNAKGNDIITELPDFNTSKVTNFAYLAMYMTALNKIPNWDFTKATDMTGAFSYCKGLTELKDYTLETAENCKLDYLFYMSGLLNIKNFEFITNATSNYMFSKSTNLVTIDGLKDLGGGTNTYAFQGCTALTSAKNMEFDSSTLTYLFDGCTNLTEINGLSIKYTNNVYPVPSTLPSYINLSKLFNNCTKLTSVDNITLGESNNINYYLLYMFAGCKSLSKIPEITVPDNVYILELGYFAYQCDALERIEGISFKYITAIPTNFFTITSTSIVPKLRYMLIKDLGYARGTTTACTIDFSNNYYKFWGTNDENNPDAELSLYDSLYTYSYDRVSNGISTKCTIKLNAIAKAIYTSWSQERKDAIAAKGFTIS